MDEPTSNLDFGNQVRVLEEIKKLSQKGLGVLMTTHSPDHAFLCSNKVALMQRSSIIVGSPNEVVTEQNLKDAYGINVTITCTCKRNGEKVKSCVPMLN